MEFDLMGLLTTLGTIQKPPENKTAMAEMSDDVAMKQKIEAEVARVLAAEGASEGRQGMIAVANTIGNRAKDSGKSLLDVITQKNQYYGYTAPNKEKLYQQVKKEADQIAKDLVAGKLVDTTGGAKYFLLPKEKVRSWHGEKTVKIGQHTFYKEAKRK